MAKLLTNKDFIARSKKMGVYDSYIFLDKYKNTRTPIRVIHKKCGSKFSILPREWFRGNNRCKKCILKEKWHNPIRSTKEAADLVLKCISSNYKLCSVSYKINDSGKGSYYVRLYNKKSKEYINPRFDHVVSDKRHMDNDKYVKSVGEIRIKSYFDSNNIGYVSPKTFNDLVDKGRLHYDFYVPKYYLLIEYQGEQHFNKDKQISNKNFAYELQHKHDIMKRDYAKKHGFNYLEIPYTVYSYKDIYHELNRYLKSLNANYPNKDKDIV